MTLCKRMLFLLIFICCLISTAGANQISTLQDKPFLLQVGGFWAHQGKSQNIPIVDLIGDHFTINNQYNFNGLLGIGYFVNGPLNLSYGINTFYLGKTDVSGKVVQENLFTNLSYKYSITQFPLYFDIKKTPDSLPWLNLDLGLGANFIRTQNFSEKSLDRVTIPDHAFKGETTTAFSATIGISILLNQFLECAPLAIGYRFFYLGEGELKKRDTQILKNLHTGNSYAHALVLSLSV